MKCLWKSYVILSFIQNLVFGQGKTEKLVYPESKKMDIADTLFRKVIHDPYRSLEDMKSLETQNWVTQQDNLLKTTLHTLPYYETIKKRISELNKYDLYRVPVKVNGKYFYLKTQMGKSRAVLYSQSSLTGAPEVVLDPEKEFVDSLTQIHASASGTMAGFFPSPNGKYLAYFTSNGRTRWFSTRFRNLENKKENENDVLDGLHILGGAVVWSKNNDGIYYVKYDLPDKNNLLKAPAINPGVYFHRLGSKQSDDQLVFRLDEPGNWTYQINTNRDGSMLLFDVRNGAKIENRIYVKLLQASADVIPLLTKEEANYSFLANAKDEFFFYTNLNAPKGKIVGVNLTAKTLYDIIPESTETISGGSLVGGNALGYFGDKFLITYIKDGLSLLRTFDNKGKELYETQLPIDGSIWGGFWGNADDDEVFYSFFGFTDPTTIYRLDAKTGRSTPFKTSGVKFNSADVITKQVFYTNEEGRKVPMFISHRKNLKLDGTHPAIMFAYGALNWIPFLWYQEHLLIWLEMGGIYAQPSIRGGGEYGEDWHQAGIRRNRQNAVDDFHAAAQWLIDNHYTSAKKLVANGGSLSSPLGGIAVLQRPDLFGGLILDRPALDMLRYTKFTTGRSWISELGDPDNAEDFETLFRQSPYHQIDPNTTYPPTLIMVGDQDQVTPPAHAYKFTAAMQSNKHSNAPVLLKMMWGTGHTFGNTPEQVTDSRTDQIVFLIKTLKVEEMTKQFYSNKKKLGQLQSELDNLNNQWSKNADNLTKKIYEEGVLATQKSGITQMAKQVGEEAPNFKLTNATGKAVTLSDYLNKGPVILTWYRGGWCPYCNITLRHLQQALPMFKELGATLLALTPELPDSTMSTKEKLALDFEVLSDMGNTVGKKYGVVFKLTKEVAHLYQKGINLHAYNGNDSDELPLAATYIIDRDGKIRFAFLHPDYRKRAEPEDILTALKKLRK